MSGPDRLQAKGRKANHAQPLDASKNKGGPERYPATGSAGGMKGQTRTFDAQDKATTPAVNRETGPKD